MFNSGQYRVLSLLAIGFGLNSAFFGYGVGVVVAEFSISIIFLILSLSKEIEEKEKREDDESCFRHGNFYYHKQDRTETKESIFVEIDGKSYKGIQFTNPHRIELSIKESDCDYFEKWLKSVVEDDVVHPKGYKKTITFKKSKAEGEFLGVFCTEINHSENKVILNYDHYNETYRTKVV